jgi:hypothetical protein
MIILPGTPLFDHTLASVPPPWLWREVGSTNYVSFVADHETGLLRPVDPEGLSQYIDSGEYDERLKSIGGDDELGDFDHDSDPEYD